VAQRLLNKVAVVTGASGRVGRAVVQKFADEGAKIVAFARNAARLDEVAQLAPARIIVVPGDVTQAHDLAMLRETTLRRLGRIDILVAAAHRSVAAPLQECSSELVDRIFAVNFQGVLQTIRVLDGQLNSPASIVLVSAPPLARPRTGDLVFAASKAAVSSLAKTLAVELAPRGIRVNCVAPTWPRDKTDLAVTAAQGVLFFASEESAGITGQEIVVDASA
jgi:NAD(P)-dependent dehydrogenase (short-subunit alcohol dehydrogenase family)